jgi:hypothetical protein
MHRCVDMRAGGDSAIDSAFDVKVVLPATFFSE